MNVLIRVVKISEFEILILTYTYIKIYMATEKHMTRLISIKPEVIISVYI